jgi:ribosomal protein L15
LSTIDSVFKNGDTITRQTLVDKAILAMYKGRLPQVKILAGTLSKKVTLKGMSCSVGVKAAIEKAGGTINE